MSKEKLQIKRRSMFGEVMVRFLRKPIAVDVYKRQLACGAALCARAEADHHALNFFGCNSLKEFRIRKLHNISSKLLQMQ